MNQPLPCTWHRWPELARFQQISLAAAFVWQELPLKAAALLVPPPGSSRQRRGRMHQHDNKDLLPQTSSWSRGVTVSTLDSESSDRGSNPRETLHDAAVALHLVQPSPCGCSHCPTGGGASIRHGLCRFRWYLVTDSCLDACLATEHARRNQTRSYSRWDSSPQSPP